MASINYAAKEISVKVVYYGPGLSGKTTNLQIIHRKVPKEYKSEMVSLATETDRTLFFDFLPLNLGKIKGFTAKFQLYTVPGQVYYSVTRKLVLRGVDGIVFVADSAADKINENLESFQNMEDNLTEYGYKREEIPIILQYNKRDLPNALPVEELQNRLNRYNLQYTEAVANKGEGVFESLKLIGKTVIDELNRKYSRKPSSGSAPVHPTPAPQAAAAPAPQPVRPAAPAPAPMRQTVTPAAAPMRKMPPVSPFFEQQQPAQAQSYTPAQQQEETTVMPQQSQDRYTPTFSVPQPGKNQQFGFTPPQQPPYPSQQQMMPQQYAQPQQPPSYPSQQPVMQQQYAQPRQQSYPPQQQMIQQQYAQPQQQSYPPQRQMNQPQQQTKSALDLEIERYQSQLQQQPPSYNNSQFESHQVPATAPGQPAPITPQQEISRATPTFRTPFSTESAKQSESGEYFISNVRTPSRHKADPSTDDDDLPKKKTFLGKLFGRG
jgi:signal recognition particle receptor subunit beta